MLIQEYTIVLLLLTFLYVMAFIYRNEVLWSLTVIMSIIGIAGGINLTVGTVTMSSYIFITYSAGMLLLSMSFMVYDLFIKYLPDKVFKKDVC